MSVGDQASAPPPHRMGRLGLTGGLGAAVGGAFLAVPGGTEDLVGVLGIGLGAGGGLLPAAPRSCYESRFSQYRITAS